MLSSLSNGVTWNKGSDVWQGWNKSCCAGTNLNVMLPQKLCSNWPWCCQALNELSCELVVVSLIRHPNSVLSVHAAVLHQPISMSRFSPQIEPLLRRHYNRPSPAKADATSAAGDTAALLWNYCAGAPWRALPKGLSRPHRVAVRCHADSSIQLPLLLIPPGIRYRRESLLGSLFRSRCMMPSDFLRARSSRAWRRLKPSTALDGIAACYSHLHNAPSFVGAGPEVAAACPALVGLPLGSAEKLLRPCRCEVLQWRNGRQLKLDACNSRR